MAIVIAVAPLAGLALEATRLAHSTWATTEMRTVAANTLIQGSAGNSSPLIEAAHLKAGERFYTVDWDIGGVFDYRRPDKADWVNPNLSAPLGVEDLRGYEPARSARYGAWIESAAGWPADKIPWRSHFALPYPKFTPHEPGLAEANVTHAIFPIWGLPLDVRSGDASAEKPTMYRGATPRVAELEFRIIAVLDPTITTPRKAFVVRESGSPIEFDLTNSELAFKQAPEFIRDPARFRLFRISPPAPPPSVSPIVGILLPLAPTDTLLGVYIWNPTLDQQYDFIAESGMAALFRVRSQKESWIQVEASDASLPVQWREIERRIGSTWLRIELETAQNQSVVIRDSYWPGWNAWVNGQYVRVSPSGPNRKGPWRVIKLPARNSPDPVKYQIEMRYFPPGLTGALALTVLAVTVCVAVSLFGRRKGT